MGSVHVPGPPASQDRADQALAEYLFDDETAMVRRRHSEYMEKHSGVRLMRRASGLCRLRRGRRGSPKRLRRRGPISVLLSDEIEKRRHPDVFNVLLQVLDDAA